MENQNKTSTQASHPEYPRTRDGSLKALFVWSGGVLPDYYHDRMSDAVACVGKDGKNGRKGGSIFIAWHSGKNDDAKHAEEWKEMQALGKRIGFTPIDLAPVIKGVTDEIPELGIKTNEAYRSHVKAAVEGGHYATTSELLKFGTVANKKEEDAAVLLDVDFRLNKNVAMVDFLDEEPRMRYNYMQLRSDICMLWNSEHPKGTTEYEKKCAEMDSLGYEFGFKPIDISPLLRGEETSIEIDWDTTIAISEENRRYLKEALDAKEYDKVNDFFANTKFDDAFQRGTPDKKGLPPREIASILHEKIKKDGIFDKNPGVRCGLIMRETQAREMIDFVAIPSGLPNPWKQSFLEFPMFSGDKNQKSNFTSQYKFGMGLRELQKHTDFASYYDRECDIPLTYVQTGRYKLEADGETLTCIGYPLPVILGTYSWQRGGKKPKGWGDYSAERTDVSRGDQEAQEIADKIRTADADAQAEGMKNCEEEYSLISSQSKTILELLRKDEELKLERELSKKDSTYWDTWTKTTPLHKQIQILTDFEHSGKCIPKHPLSEIPPRLRHLRLKNAEADLSHPRLEQQETSLPRDIAR